MTSLSSFIPSLTWLRAYRRQWLRKDLVGGLAAGAVVIPQAMAYASIADLPAQVGLYTCMVPMVVYAFLGGSRTMSVSTTSTVAVLTASTLLAAGLAAGSDNPAGTLAALTLMVGVVLLLARLLRLGSLIDNISEATLVGVKIGVGLTVAASQLPKLLGITSDPGADAFFQEMRSVLDHIDDTSVVTLAFSAGTLMVLVVLKRWLPAIPAPLVAVVGGIVLVSVWSLDEHGLALIAEVPSGLPTPVAPALDAWRDLLPGAFAIAIMCFLESASVAGAVRRPAEPPIDNDQELVAAGLSNVAGAFFRAMPSAGGFSQTAMNQSSGSQTQVSELVTTTLAIACAVFLGAVLSDLPQATLGCLVMIAVIGLISPREMVRFWRLDRLEFWVAALTAAVGLTVGLLAAVLVGVIVTLLLVLHELNQVSVVELQPNDGRTDLQIVDGTVGRVPGLLVLRFDGPLYTANIRSANRRVLAAVDAAELHGVLVLDVTDVALVSLTVADQMADLEHGLTERGVTLWIAALSPRATAMAQKMPGWARFSDPPRIYATSLAAVRAFVDSPRS